MTDRDVFPVPASRPRRSLSNSEDAPYSGAAGGSQEPSQTQTEVLTQNLDLTQLGDFDDEENLSNFPPFSPPAEEKLPWGKLLPCKDGLQGVDLMPKAPKNQIKSGTSAGGGAMDGFSLLGLEQIRPADIFNEYSIGRSTRCDVQANKPQDETTKRNKAMHDWAYGLISNTHCRIYCALDTSTNRMQTFVEDCSGNGTLINKTTILRRGEKRLLHAGDEICLLNPQMIQKKIKAKKAIQALMEQHGFIFVLQQHTIWAHPDSNRRKSAVNIRNIKSHSVNVAHVPTPTDASSVSLQGRKRTSSSGHRRVSPRRQQKPRIEEEYDIRDLLGTGTVGEVRRAIHRKTGTEYAVKVISIGGRNRATYMLESGAAFEAEAAILRELQHPYIVNLNDVFMSPQAIYLVMELLHGGDLFDRIVQKGKYSEVDGRRVMRRLLSATYYLHEARNIVHRDIKPENILLVNRESDVEVKLTDFGLAKAVNGEEGLKTFCGTPQYFAPEVLRRRHTVAGRGRYGKQADMWSIGVVLYVLLSGTPPFDVNEGFDVVADAKIEFPEAFWFGVSNEAKNLVMSLLVADPRRRMTIQDACQHPWIMTEDGDSHVHPLDDPKLGTSRKTLFQAATRRVPKPTLPTLPSLNNFADSGVSFPASRRSVAVTEPLPRPEALANTNVDASAPPTTAEKTTSTRQKLYSASTTQSKKRKTPKQKSKGVSDKPSLGLRLMFEQTAALRQSPSRNGILLNVKVPVQSKSKEKPVEDDILSSFSEKSDSIGSFGTMDTLPTKLDPNENEPSPSTAEASLLVSVEETRSAKPKKGSRRITDSIGTVLSSVEPSPKEKANRVESSNSKKRKPKSSRVTSSKKKKGRPSKSSDSSPSPAAKTQPKISSWFQKLN